MRYVTSRIVKFLSHLQGNKAAMRGSQAVAAPRLARTEQQPRAELQTFELSSLYRHQKNLKGKKREREREAERERAAHRQRDEKLLASLQRRDEFAVVQTHGAGNEGELGFTGSARLVLQRRAGCGWARFKGLISEQCWIKTQIAWYTHVYISHAQTSSGSFHQLFAVSFIKSSTEVQRQLEFLLRTTVGSRVL